MIQFFKKNVWRLAKVFSAEEHLTHSYTPGTWSDGQSLKGKMISTGIEWRKLLRSFSNVKTLGVEDGLVAYDWKTENFP